MSNINNQRPYTLNNLRDRFPLFSRDRIFLPDGSRLPDASPLPDKFIIIPNEYYSSDNVFDSSDNVFHSFDRSYSSDKPYRSSIVGEVLPSGLRNVLTAYQDENIFGFLEREFPETSSSFNSQEHVRGQVEHEQPQLQLQPQAHPLHSRENPNLSQQFQSLGKANQSRDQRSLDVSAQQKYPDKEKVQKEEYKQLEENRKQLEKDLKRLEEDRKRLEEDRKQLIESLKNNGLWANLPELSAEQAGLSRRSNFDHEQSDREAKRSRKS